MTFKSFEEWVDRLNKTGMNPDFRNQMAKKGYSPLNFDCDSKERAIEMAKNLYNYFYKLGYEVWWRRSSSGRGFHFTIVKNGKQVYVLTGKALFLRKKFGDCYGRLKCDILRNRYSKLGTGILFNIKNSRFAGEWTELNLDSFVKMVKEEIRAEEERKKITWFIQTSKAPSGTYLSSCCSILFSKLLLRICYLLAKCQLCFHKLRKFLSR
ncbi:MAG: hypothetical protein ACTSYM_00425 [Candidatus Baldrarchaeia archaeon]